MSHGHDHHGKTHDHHGNPHDFDGYLKKLVSPERDEWQKPDQVIRALGLRKGAVAAEIGVGPGYFALRMARAVGPKGRVFAVDVDLRLIDELRKRMAAGRVRNLTPVLALDDDPLLPPASCDLIAVINTFHHFPDGVAYLRKLVTALRPGGRIVNIDFHKRELPLGPHLLHKIDRDDFVALAKRARLRVVDEPTFLPYQYFLVMRPS